MGLFICLFFMNHECSWEQIFIYLQCKFLQKLGNGNEMKLIFLFRSMTHKGMGTQHWTDHVGTQRSLVEIYGLEPPLVIQTSPPGPCF